MKIFLSAFFWPFYSWLFISVVAPTSVTGPQFVHIQEKDALRISISKNSPPIAAISDEILAQVSFEPTEEVKVDKYSIELNAGNAKSWDRLKKISDNFEREKIRKIENQKIAEALAAKIEKESSVIESKQIIVSYKINELIKLVEPITETYTETYVEKNTAQPEPKKEMIAVAGNQINTLKPPTAVLAAEVSNQKTAINNKPVAQIKQSLLSQQEYYGLDSADNNNYVIKGQVELNGGLALIENTTSLKVFWKTALNEELADVDNANGKFIINVSDYKAGKLVAHLMDENKKVIGLGLVDFSEQAKPEFGDVKISIDPLLSSKGGQVISAYSYDKVKMLVPGAEVYGAAKVREPVDYKGVYKLSQLGGNSTYLLQAHAPEHWLTEMIVEAGTKQNVPLFPAKMLQNFFEIIKQQDNASEYGLIWGKVSKKDQALKNAEVKLANQAHAIGPIYFNDLYIPDLNLTKTSSNGLFAFVKVNPGLNVIYSKWEDKMLPSSVVTTNQNTVSYVEIKAKSIEIKGEVFDPIYQHGLNSNISIIGYDQQIQSNSQTGFLAKIPSQDSVLHLNFYQGPEYFISREAIPRTQAKQIRALAVRKAWLHEELRGSQLKQEESLGAALGYINGGQYIAYIDGDKASEQNTYYLNENNKLDVSKADSNQNGGAFMIINIKPGLHTLVIRSSDGQIINSRLFIAEAGVLNTFNFDLKY